MGEGNQTGGLKMDEQTKEAFKQNLINLVAKHKECCDRLYGIKCNVSLCAIYLMMTEAGYTFTKEELSLFF
jgi:hypothetical protein